MRAAWAALSLLLLPGLGRRALPHMATGTPGTPGTAPGTPLGTPLGTPGTALGTSGTAPGTPLGTPLGTSGTPLGTPGDACGTTGNSTGGDTRGGDTRGGDSRGGDSRGGDSRGGDSRGGDSDGGTRGGDSDGGTGGGTGGDTGYEPGSVSAAFVTCPNLSVATELARALVLQGLAACVNIVPGVTSVYSWQGKLEEDSEVLLMIKTRSSRVPALTEFVRRQHPYEVPEVVALPVAQGNAPYLRWVRDVVPP